VEKQNIICNAAAINEHFAAECVHLQSMYDWWCIVKYYLHSPSDILNTWESVTLEANDVGLYQANIGHPKTVW